MTRALILVLTLAVLNQVSAKKSLNIGNLMTQGVARKFEETLNAHMKEVKEVHEPLFSIFKEKGCEIPTRNDIVSEDLLNRLEECVALTEEVAVLEADGLYFYFRAKDYARVSLEAAINATECLEHERISVIAVCLLQGVNDYGFQIGLLNDDVRILIETVRFISGNIIYRFNGCFGTDVSTLQDLTRVHTERCRSKRRA